MQRYKRGTTVTLYANFLAIDGKEATSVVDPKVTIRHTNSGGTLVVDVNEATMTLGVETLYFYRWTIPATADLTEYTIEYEAIIDGEYGEANETAIIIEQDSDECTTIYTSEQKVADYLGVDVASINSVWLIWASRYIDFYTCQSFCTVTTTEKYDIEKKGQDYLFLDHNPLIEVIELQDDGTVVPDEDYLVYKDEGMIKFQEDFLNNITILKPGPFTYGRQRVQVTYRYGRNSIPEEIEWAATVLTASIARQSLVQSGEISEGTITEEEIGEYRRKKSLQDSSNSFGSVVEESREINNRLIIDIFNAKNVLSMYKSRKIRAV